MQIRREAFEVNGVVASEDGRLLVIALADGILQWRRADTGAELLSLFPSRDGRWVIWTPEGYFDASPGAERLVAWVVNRGPTESAEAYPFGRFRDVYRRPDIIDRVLETLDTRIAIEEAPPTTRPALLKTSESDLGESAILVPPPSEATPDGGSRHKSPPSSTGTDQARPDKSSTQSAKDGASESKEVIAVSPVAAAPEQFPPTLLAQGALSIRVPTGVVELPFAIRSPRRQDRHWLALRIDGRPATAVRWQMPATFDGKSKGFATIELRPGITTVQLLARNETGFSEPLNFRVEVQALRKSPAAQGRAELPNSSASLTQQNSSVSDPGNATEKTSRKEKVSPAASSTVAASSDGSCPANVRDIRGRGEKTADIDLAESDNGPRRPTLYILAVGISKYGRDEYSLGFPAKDAMDFANAMRKQAGRQYDDVVTHVLTNAQGTRRAVLDCLSWISMVTGRGDVAMVFLAGHGINQDTGQYYFLGHDAQVEKLAKTGVAERDLRNSLRRIRGRTIFFIDTCYSGNVVGDPRIGNRDLSRLADDLASSENGVVIYAGSSGRQPSLEHPEWGNGAFTKSLVEGLAGGADFYNSGRITFKGLDLYVSNAVRKLTKGRQTPVTITPIGVPDFVLALTKA